MTREFVETCSGDRQSPIVFTCEHASSRMCDPWRWPEEDLWLRDTHWACDIGAANLTRALSERFIAPAVLAGFSRLLADPNRPLDSPTLFRKMAEGRPVHLNAGLSEADRAARLESFYHPYHDAVDEMLGACAEASLVFAVHTFTPHYQGLKRSMEIGVLFDEEEALSQVLCDALKKVGFKTAMNEPYSGKEGLIYSPQMHARKHQRHAIEIELRQDLTADRDVQRRVVEAVAAFVEEVG